MVNLVPWKRKTSSPAANTRPANLFKRFFDEPFLPVFDPFNRSEWWPRVDVREGRSSITVEAEIPGMDKEDIDLSIEDRNLHIKGKKSKEDEESREGYYRVERSFGYFNRTVELPAAVDDTSVDAKYKRGVLKVKLKKLKENGTKRIRIASAAE